MKRNYIKSTILLLCLWLSFSIKAYDFKSGGIYYNITSETELTVSVSNNGHNSYSGEITIPETVEYNRKTFKVTSIGDHAFWGCSELTAITIPKSATSIEEWGFSACQKLTTITIPEGIKSIGESAFFGCWGLNEFKVDDENLNYSVQEGVLFNKDKTKLISHPAAPDKLTYVIPNNVTSIGGYAFLGCTKLSTIIIQEGVTCIGEWAFMGCSGLTTITIPESVKTIGDGAFGNCYRLTKITILEGVKSIGKDAFLGCSGLTTITIPESVKTIGDGAFSYCSKLTTINIPESITSIEDGTFWSSGLTAINIPKSVKTIGSSAFKNCLKLAVITIPEWVTFIGADVFMGCSELTSVIVKNPIPPTTIINFTFDDVVGKNAKLYVPKNSIDSYRNAPDWKKFLNITDEEYASVGENNINDVKIYAGNGCVVVENAPYGENISVYSNNGIVLKSLPISGNRTEVRLPAGVYIVTCYNKTVKVRL